MLILGSSWLHKLTYTRVRLGNTLENSDVERHNLWKTNFLVVPVEPQVMRTISAHVELFSIQVNVPRHDSSTTLLIIIIIAIDY